MAEDNAHPSVDHTLADDSPTLEAPYLEVLPGAVGPNVWGSFISLANRNGPMRMLFTKSKRKYTVGQDPSNDVIIPDILPFQCIIEWDGDCSTKSSVTLTNMSGQTWLGERLMEKNSSSYLHNGTEIQFRVGTASRHNAYISYLFKRHNLPDDEMYIPEGLKDIYDMGVRLGSGGFGIVMKGLKRDDNTQWAIKFHRQGVMEAAMNNENLNKQIRREFEVLSTLEHLNIVGFKDAPMDGRGLCLVMEYIQEGDLSKYLKKQPNGRLNERTASEISYQICDALAYLHRKKVAHRDLKPGNILIANTETPPLIKLGDFGLAKIVDSMTNLHTYVGTPLYRAPEIRKDITGPYDNTVDSWSLGVTVAEMLFGKHPFHDFSSRNIDEDLFRCYHVSPDGQDFLKRLLKYQPEERMTSAQALEHPWLMNRGAGGPTNEPVE